MFKFRKDFYVKAFKKKNLRKQKNRQTKRESFLGPLVTGSLVFEDEVGTTCSDL